MCETTFASIDSAVIEPNLPNRPPCLKQKPRAKPKAWASPHKSRQERGYGREHDLMRALVLQEDALCGAQIHADGSPKNDGCVR